MLNRLVMPILLYVLYSLRAEWLLPSGFKFKVITGRATAYSPVVNGDYAFSASAK